MIQLPPRIQTKKPRRDNRIRSAAHLAFVRTFGCCVPGCAGRPVAAHHVRLGTDGAASIRPGDNWAISLCHDHHTAGGDAVHRLGEESFAIKFALDLLALASEFWRRSPYRARVEAKLRRTA